MLSDRPRTPTWGHPHPVPNQGCPGSAAPSTESPRQPVGGGCAADSTTPSSISSAPSLTLTNPQTVQRFSATFPINLQAFTQSVAQVAAANILLVDEDAAEKQWQEEWAALLRLPETIDQAGGVVKSLEGCLCRVVREGNLAQVHVSRKPGLHALQLHQTLINATTESSSSATSRRTPRTQGQARADMGRRGVRKPDMAWMAKGRVTGGAGIARPVSVSETGEIKSEVEKAKAGFAQGLLYAVLSHELSGAQLGFSVFRERFARFFVLSDRLVACDRLLSPASNRAAPHLTSCDALLDFLDGLTNAEFVRALPLSLRREPDSDEVDPDSLQYIARWAVAGYRCILRLPQEGPFLPFPPSRSVVAMEAQARLQLDSEEQCVRGLKVARSNIRTASGRRGFPPAKGGDLPNPSSDSLDVQGGGRLKRAVSVAGTRGHKRHRSVAASSAAGQDREEPGSSGKVSNHDDDSGSRQAATDSSEPGHDTAEIAALEVRMRELPAVEEEDGNVDGDDEREGEEGPMPEDDDVFWGDGGRKNIDVPDRIPMPTVLESRASVASPESEDDTLSESAALDMLRRSGIRVIFLHPDVMDRLIEEEKEEATAKPVTEATVSAVSHQITV